MFGKLAALCTALVLLGTALGTVAVPTGTTTCVTTVGPVHDTVCIPVG